MRDIAILDQLFAAAPRDQWARRRDRWTCAQSLYLTQRASCVNVDSYRSAWRSLPKERGCGREFPVHVWTTHANTSTSPSAYGGSVDLVMFVGEASPGDDADVATRVRGDVWDAIERRSRCS